MFGTIIGDMAGENIEVLEIKAKKSESQKRSYTDRIKVMDQNYELINDSSSYTDDTVLSMAILDALLSRKNYKDKLIEYGKKEINLGKDKYGRNRFGNGFMKWLEDSSLNNSLGNGSAMRVAPIGYYFNTLDKILENAKLQSIITHNTNDAINASQAVACTIYLARHIKNKEKIKKIIESLFNYNLDYDIEKLRRENTFSALAKDTVPLAIYSFLISNDFTDAIKISLSIGGDADTIASITGAISEAYYGIPLELIKKIFNKLPNQYKRLLSDFYNELNLKQILFKLGIIDDNFYKYIGDKIERNYITDPINWKVFPIYDHQKLIDMKIHLPYLTSKESFNINISIIYKAYKIYQSEKNQNKIKVLHK